MLDPNRLDNRNEELIARLAGWIERVALPYHRARVDGVDNVPAGPALIVGNHSGATLSIDSFILAHALYERFGVDTVPYGLAHDMAVDLPILNHVLCQLGAVRASHENARAVFEAGRKLIVYPGGDVEAMRPYWRRDEVDFAGRVGFARLAIRQQVPIVPVAAQGAHGTLIVLHDFKSIARRIGLTDRTRIGVFPVSFLLPYGLWFGPTPPYFPLPAKIRISVLPAMAPPTDEDHAERFAFEVERAIQDEVWRLADLDGERYSSR